MIKSPLRYPGGKSRAIKLFSTLIPEFDEFREPFLGGGSIFIYAKQRFLLLARYAADLLSLSLGRLPNPESPESFCLLCPDESPSHWRLPPQSAWPNHWAATVKSVAFIVPITVSQRGALFDGLFSDFCFIHCGNRLSFFCSTNYRKLYPLCNALQNFSSVGLTICKGFKILLTK